MFEAVLPVCQCVFVFFIPKEQDLDTNGLDATVTIGMSAPYGFLMKKVKNLQECLKKCLNAAGGIADTPIDAVGPGTDIIDNSIQAQYQVRVYVTGTVKQIRETKEKKKKMMIKENNNNKYQQQPLQSNYCVVLSVNSVSVFSFL